MKLRCVVLACLTAMAAPVSWAKESLAEEGPAPITPLELEEYGRTETAGIAVKRGLSWNNGTTYDNTAASVILSGYLIELRLRREETAREKVDDTLEIGDFSLEGTRRYQVYLADLTFGMELYELGRRYYDLKVYGQVTGGFQATENNLLVGEGEDQEQIPGDPDFAFFTGGGGRGEAVFRIPKIESYCLSLGLGGTLEYLRSDNDVSSWNNFKNRPAQGFNASAYGLLRLSREKERKELRIKKE